MKECTQFKPTIAFTIFKFLNSTKILDFSAGWGDRLIAAIAAKVNLYIGVDPNKELEKGHKEIIETFCNQEEKIKQFQIIYSPFQTVNLPENTKFDLIFTSPPFFDLEYYSNLPGQSIIDYPNLNDWLHKFLFSSLQKSWSFLEENGYLAIHLSDFGQTKIVEITNLFIQVSITLIINCNDYSC